MPKHNTHKATPQGRAVTLSRRNRKQAQAKAHRELATSFERFMMEHNERQRVGGPLTRLATVYKLEVTQ